MTEKNLSKDVHDVWFLYQLLSCRRFVHQQQLKLDAADDKDFDVFSYCQYASFKKLFLMLQVRQSIIFSDWMEQNMLICYMQRTWKHGHKALLFILSSVTLLPTR